MAGDHFSKWFIRFWQSSIFDLVINRLDMHPDFLAIFAPTDISTQTINKIVQLFLFKVDTNPFNLLSFDILLRLF